MSSRDAYLTLPASALERLLHEAASAGIDPLWLLAALAAELRDGLDPKTT
jgi:hypothetical protein